MAAPGPFPQPAPPRSELERYRILSPSCGLRVSPLCLGAMSYGQAWSGFMGSMSKEETFDLLDKYYELGGNFIDTANNYQWEESETWIGEWLAKTQVRDEMVIATKFTIGYKHENKIRVNFQGNHYKSMFLSIDASLKKLQTTYVDILYLHFWDYSTSIEEIMQGLNNLVKSGKVLYLGISDTPAWIVADCNRYAREHGLAQFVIYQGRWSVASRDFEREILPMARKWGMAIAPWGAIGRGKWQSKADQEIRAKSGETFRAGGVTADDEKMAEALEKVANELGTKSLTAVALAYVLQKTPYVFPIIGGRKISQLLGNIESLSLTLTPEQMSYLESILPFDVGFPANFIGQDPHVYDVQPMIAVSASGYRSFVKGETAIKPGV